MGYDGGELTNYGAAMEGGGGGGFNTNLLVQLLSGMGGALGGKGSWQEAAGGLLRQNQSSKGYMSLLQKLLGGLPEGAKVSGDRSGLTFKTPLSGMSEGTGGGGGGVDLSSINQTIGGGANPFGFAPFNPNPVSAVPTNATGAGFVGGGGGIDMPNPSSSPLRINSADLVGLTPENITQALQLKFGREDAASKNAIASAEQGRLSRSDLVDAMYKQAQIRKIDQGEAIDKPFPVAGPGGRTLTNRQWAELPAGDRSYYLYLDAVKDLGPDSKIMSKSQWDAYTPTDHVKMLNQLNADPELMKTELALRTAGATKIDLGAKLNEKKEMAAIEGQNYLKTPDFNKDITAHMGSKPIAEKIWNAKMEAGRVPKGSTPEVKKAADEKAKVAGSKAEASAVMDFITDRITTARGEIINREVLSDKKTVRWTVKWPNGDTEKISYRVVR